jgi:hypothetical protein
MPNIPDMPRDPAYAERRLMAAVLMDAVAVLATDLPHPRNHRLREETRNWVMACDREWPFSFENVCESLELDPDFMRTRIHQLNGAPPARVSREALRGHAPAPRVLRLVT